MKTILHKSDSRGHFDFGWLNTRHTFSFGQYHDPERMHFGALRVLNDDIVQGGKGFGFHGHDNMEIVSIPISGSLEHRDSTGGHGIIKPGEVQIMSAGSGIRHSEFNASATDPVNFLQIWVFPKVRDITPGYSQKAFDPADRINKIVPVVSPDEESGALGINQDARFSLGSLKSGTSVTYDLKFTDNGVYIFVIEGSADAANQSLSRRDGLGVWDTDKVALTANADTELLLIEVPLR